MITQNKPYSARPHMGPAIVLCLTLALASAPAVRAGEDVFDRLSREAETGIASQGDAAAAALQAELRTRLGEAARSRLAGEMPHEDLAGAPRHGNEANAELAVEGKSPDAVPFRGG